MFRRSVRRFCGDVRCLLSVDCLRDMAVDFVGSWVDRVLVCGVWQIFVASGCGVCVDCGECSAVTQLGAGFCSLNIKETLSMSSAPPPLYLR